MAGLEESFTQFQQRHSERQVVLSKSLEKAKKAALAAAIDVSGLLVDSVNVGVQESFINEERVEMEARALAGTVQLFTKQTVQWLSMFHTFDSALKEIGDFENWIKVMEYDLESIGKALTYISAPSNSSS